LGFTIFGASVGLPVSVTLSCGPAGVGDGDAFKSALAGTDDDGDGEAEAEADGDASGGAEGDALTNGNWSVHE
jgi:hypothetical protein